MLSAFTKTLPSFLLDQALSVAEAAALACYQWVGRGEEKLADHAAVSAMRHAFQSVEMQGRIVIGEGERDEAPMLYIGEEVGSGVGAEIDIAVDPLEGTTLCAMGRNNALAVLALAERGSLLHSPDVYMEKLVIGRNIPPEAIHLSRSVTENIYAIAEAKKCKPYELNAVVLDRPRHENLIAELRQLHVNIHLIQDGDIAGAIATCAEKHAADLYIGTGGAPEGVLAGVALKAMGGYMQGRLLFSRAAEWERAEMMGIKNPNHIYDLHEMVQGDAIFVATAITPGTMLEGISVNKARNEITTHSLALHVASKQKRIITTHHPLLSNFLSPSFSPS